MKESPLVKSLACPLDGTALQRCDRQYVCSQGHSFDISRQGYVNLLPVQHKRSKEPGDSKGMISARTAFLNDGHYQPISERLNEIVQAVLVRENDCTLLDAGCGEGYYLDRLYHCLQDHAGQSNVNAIGLDIAKWAVMAASKRNRDIQWVVGSNKKPPVLDTSLDMIVCLFGFPYYAGFRKALKPGAKIILVDPGPEHLIELREVIYPTVKHSVVSTLSQAHEEGFQLMETDLLQYTIEQLNQKQIQNLLEMTPHLYRASRAGKMAAMQLEKIDLTIDVTYRVLVLGES